MRSPNEPEHRVKRRGISAEAIDPRKPLDLDIVASVRRTNRVVVVRTGEKSGGVRCLVDLS